MLAYYGSRFNCVIAVLVWYQPSALAGGVVKHISVMTQRRLTGATCVLADTFALLKVTQ